MPMLMRASTGHEEVKENPQGWGYAVFGKVTEGMDVVDKIADVATGSSGGHQDVPVDLITIESVTVSE